MHARQAQAGITIPKLPELFLFHAQAAPDVAYTAAMVETATGVGLQLGRLGGGSLFDLGGFVSQPLLKRSCFHSFRQAPQLRSRGMPSWCLLCSPAKDPSVKASRVSLFRASRRVGLCTRLCKDGRTSATSVRLCEFSECGL